MKVILLSGGFGTRLSEKTESIPKPMIPIGGKPLLWHIMSNYAYFGHKDFILALGYKAEVIKEYFLHYSSLSSDFTVNLGDGTVIYHQTDRVDWNVTLVNTGLNTMTGGRVKRLQEFIGEETFLLTYGDGLSDVDVNAVCEFHKQHGKMITVTAVRPVARFGELSIDSNRVTRFLEKPQLAGGWINGGFFVIDPPFFELIEGDSTMLEREPMEVAAEMGELMAYRHEGYWQCMDTKRDHDALEAVWATGNAPWKC